MEITNYDIQFHKMGLRKPPYAFSLFGVAMLSSVLNSETAIDTNIDVMRAFVEFQTIKTLVRYGELQELKKKLEDTNSYIEEVLEDQNDINESIRSQLEAINTAHCRITGGASQTTQAEANRVYTS